MAAVIEHERLSTREFIRRRILNWERLVQLGLLVLLITAWEIAGRIMGQFFLAPPSSLGAAFLEMSGTGELWSALLDSLGSLTAGFAIAIVVGISVGFFMGWYGPAGRTLNPFISALYVVPTAALVPMFIIWFGLGFTARAVTVFLFCVFEILVSTYTGVRNVDMKLVDAARAFGASRWQLFSRVVSFASLPYIFAGLRMGVSRAVKGMVVAELLFAVTGLGGLISNAASYYRTDKVFVGVIVLSILGVILAGAVQLLERRLMPWRQTVSN
jgi:ABC-type nitrate/sulfonate/bicarbonate transport system permease component